MKILFAKCFGLGNAVMAIPAIKALHSLGHSVDVLIGSLPDDKGAWDVLSKFSGSSGCISNIWTDSTQSHYDVAIMSIPFDGRWRPGVHFKANKIIDGRTRPDPTTTGLSSWKKHEVEYQIDNAIQLGYSGNISDLDCSFMKQCENVPKTNFYIGIGYKKDTAGFWKQKHWGNAKYAALIKMILNDNPQNVVRTSGDHQDLIFSIAPIIREVNDKRLIYESGSLSQAIDRIKNNYMYIGNDTGMMHVAAAAGCKVLGLFFLENSITKSRPWGLDCHVIDGVNREVTPDEVFRKIKDICQS